MKRRTLLLIAMAGASLYSCSRTELPESYSDLEPVGSESGAIQQIILESNLKEGVAATKASIDGWNGQSLYIIGYDTVRVTQASTITAENGFVIPNQKGSAPAGQNPGQLIFPDGKTFYYEEDVQSYDFNGYYVADAEILSPASVSSGQISLDVRINGRQDILGATTDKNADRVIPDAFCDQYGYDHGSKVKYQYVYSAFSSRRGINPKLNFEHLLTKFTFAIRLGEDLAEGKKIHPITVAAFSKSEGRIVLNPRDAGGVKIKSSISATSEITAKMEMGCAGIVPAYTEEYTPVADSCLMVIPEESEYQMALFFTQDGTDGQVHRLNFPVNISGLKDALEKTDTFKAGKHYDVKLTVYGLREIQVNVSLSAWEDAGTVEYDPDDIHDVIE